MGGQWRMGLAGVLGWDLGAGLALAEALGMSRMLAAEILPEIEPVAVRAANDQLTAESDDG